MGYARRRRAGRRGIGVVLRVFFGRAVFAPEHAIEEVVVGVGPVVILIAIGPERVVEDVGIGVRPEHWAVPRHEGRAQAAVPGAPRRPVRPVPMRLTGTRLWIGRERRGEAALPRRLPCYAADAIVSCGARASGTFSVRLNQRVAGRHPVAMRPLLMDAALRRPVDGRRVPPDDCPMPRDVRSRRASRREMRSRHVLARQMRRDRTAREMRNCSLHGSRMERRCMHRGTLRLKMRCRAGGLNMRRMRRAAAPLPLRLAAALAALKLRAGAQRHSHRKRNRDRGCENCRTSTHDPSSMPPERRMAHQCINGPRAQFRRWIIRL